MTMPPNVCTVMCRCAALPFVRSGCEAGSRGINAAPYQPDHCPASIVADVRVHSLPGDCGTEEADHASRAQREAHPAVEPGLLQMVACAPHDQPHKSAFRTAPARLCICGDLVPRPGTHLFPPLYLAISRFVAHSKRMLACLFCASAYPPCTRFQVHSRSTAIREMGTIKLFHSGHSLTVRSIRVYLSYSDILQGEWWPCRAQRLGRIASSIPLISWTWISLS